MSEPVIDFWFDFASTYSYPAAMRVEAVARGADVKVRWRPFLLGPIFEAQQGIKDSPFNVHPERGRYMWRDLARLCEKYALRWKQPSIFPRNSVLAARVALVAAAEPWGPDFIRAVFTANFAFDRDIAAEAVLGELLSEVGQPTDWLVKAVSPEHRGRLREETAEGARLGIFGAPNFVVGTELFFGQDRLEDALAWAKSR